ncbi:Glycine/D-amino acid oxidase [Yoonia tamlensis]|uniref:Glycine/D-amino acid oxidase n=1 Tax=Yoonia tamlensis TaxID=390270 RepID=A0A1I6GJZ1_9RHOB|nr:FAD-binding oxidoreductase [Yoonia tamlensis]SFR42461.1 Glycine/D-amino acid oxidase [Yoonia tamlensis]
MTPFPISIDSPITYAGPPPAKADVVVIGGGIIGVMTAWEIAKQGQSVVVLEKGRIAAEQSSRNWGWVRVQGRDAAEIPIMQEAAQMWHEMNTLIGADIGLRQGGVSFLAKTKSDLDRYASWIPDAKAHGIDTRVVTKSGLADVLPRAQGDWAGALWTPGDLRAEPWTAVPAIARAATADGVTFVENCAARLLDLAAGRIAGVVTEQGLIKTSAVVVAGGAWSSLFLRRHGINIPQLSVRATVAATEPVDNVHDGAAVDHRLAFRRRADGGYTLAPSGYNEIFVGPDAFRALAKFAPQLLQNPLGTRLRASAPRGFPDAWGTQRRWAADAISPFEKMRVLNPKPNARKLAAMRQAFCDTFPQLGDVQIKTAWAGMIDTMPDVVPVVDTVQSIAGLTIATGMCGHGFGIGPGFGRVAARLALGKTPTHDITRFRLSRFTDGSKLVLGPNL